MVTDEEKKFLAEIGNRLRELRKEKGISQSHLAALADIPISQISRIERGIGNPTLLTLRNLAICLGIEVGELIIV